MKKTGAVALAKMLDAYETTHIFMVPAILRRTMAEMERQTDIKVIHTHGEKAAAYMADGYARVSGKPGVCMSQHIGSLNLAAGLRDAYLAKAPIIAMTGGSLPGRRGRGAYQEAEDLPAFTPYTKMNVVVEDAERIPDLIEQAYRVATSGCPGPVHLQFRGPEGEVEAGECLTPITPQKRHISVPPYRPAPSRADVREILRLLGSAKRPMILAGGGVAHSKAQSVLREFAERLSIPVVTSLNGRGTIEETHELGLGIVGTYSRPSANQALHKADFVLIAGSSVGSMVTNFWRLPTATAKIVQIDIDPEMLGRNFDIALGLSADIKTTVEMLLEEALPITIPASRNEWVRDCDDLFKTWSEQRSALHNSESTPIRPERLCRELSDWLPEDAVYVVDTGHAGMWMSSMFELTSTRQTYIRSAGHLGWAFPAGLGAKCAAPDRPVITFTGDLGMWYHIGDLETAVRCNINAITVVNNNHSGNQSRRGFSRAYDGAPTEKSEELWVQREVDFARIAEEIGALGIRVTDPSQLRAAFDQALAANRPVVIDVVTDIYAAAPQPWDAETGVVIT